MSIFDVISALGKGVIKTVEVVGEGVESAAYAIGDVAEAVRGTATEITAVFNATDHNIAFINREAARDNKKLIGQSVVSLRTERSAGALVPWYDPPRFDEFAKHHMVILVDGEPAIYFWQRREYLYWCNRLSDEGRPVKAYRMPGAAHVGGRRVLVFRQDPELDYSIYLIESERVLAELQ